MTTAMSLRLPRATPETCGDAHHDRQRRLVAADQRRGRYAAQHHSRTRGAGSLGRDDHARRLSHDAVPDLSGNPPRAASRRPRSRGSIEEFAARRGPHRDRGAAGTRRAPPLPAHASRPFTTAYHTQFPEYVHARIRLPVAITYRWMRWFHAPASALMVATPDVRRRLEARGFTNLAHVVARRRHRALHVRAAHTTLDDPRPIFLYAGRVAVEKNIEAFLALDLPGTKWVVGDGPARAALERRFPATRASSA